MSIESELRALQDEEDLFKPRAVVNWARDNPNSELHKYRDFYWDNDARAADEHRLNVARTLIRVYIQTDDGYRATISLMQDRKTGGGYRELDKVLSNADLRQMALKQALRDFRSWERRYKHLRELASVFEAANSIEEPPGVAAA